MMAGNKVAADRQHGMPVQESNLVKHKLLHAPELYHTNTGS
jgi:hypothetical protein